MVLLLLQRGYFMFVSDLALYRRGDGNFDLFFDGKDLQTGKSLENVVVISIGSDGRVAGSSFKNVLQDDGWWAESTFEGDRWGSLLHTLFKRKNDPNMLLLAKQYVNDSLQWLVEDGVVGSVESVVSNNAETLNISVNLLKGEVTQNYRFEILWSEVA